MLYYNPYSTKDINDLQRSSTYSASKSDLEGESGLAELSTKEQAQFGLESKSHRKLVFTDPIAFRYLEEDEATTVLARRQRLEGYELYIVEQWIVSRTHPTFTICTYTGEAKHSILVSVLAVPEDQSAWSKRLEIYFEAISQSYAREKETPLGALMVTNLSGFPSALNLISVPGGDVRKHREDFMVNEDLKRMGCSGRAAMGLQYPPVSTINKFHYMYRTSEKIPLYSSVMELVRYCQIALVLYGKLETTYADGLLCDHTEKAVSDWWNEIGFEFFNVEPSDGILGPTTVSALIGLMVGAYNRLKETGAPVSKDPVDLPAMKRAVGHFQKASKMDRTRRLDRATLDRLHRATANKVDDEGLTVTRALKSTVAGLSGKGGEMIARGLGGGKDKVGIAEVETLDIERLAQLVHGRSMKWLWQGKDKGATLLPTDELNGRVFSTDDQGNFLWTGQGNEDDDTYALIAGPETDEKERHGRKLRQAVGLTNNRQHGSRSQHTDDENNKQDQSSLPSDSRTTSRQQSHSRASRSEFPPLNLALADAPVTTPQIDRLRAGAPAAAPSRRDRNDTNLNSHRHALRGLDHHEGESPSQRQVREELLNIKHQLRDRRYQSFSAAFRFEQPKAKALRRSLSAIQLRTITEARAARLPRHLSMALLVDVFHAQDGFGEDEPPKSGDGSGPKKPSALLKVHKEELRRSQDLANKLSAFDRGLIPFTDGRISRVEYTGEEMSGQLEELNGVYYQHLEEYQTLQATSGDLVAREKASLFEAMKSIDMLGQKLDYEMDSLQSRMQEVEEGVDDFERQVLHIEASVKALIADKEKPEQKVWYERWFGIKRDGKSAEAQQTESARTSVDKKAETVNAKTS